MIQHSQLRREHGLEYWTIPAFPRWGARVWFMLRKGGVSRGPYRSLNLGLNTGDQPEKIRENRARLLKLRHFGPLLPVLGKQAHGSRIRVAARQDAGRGWKRLDDAFSATDGLITTVPGMPLAITVADCLPVLITAESRPLAAAIHVGWRGLVAGILKRAVSKLARDFRILPAKLRIAIGPGIGPTAFTISGETLTRLQRICAPALLPARGKSRARYHLGLAALHQLAMLGVPRTNITVVDECTASQARQYFSYRRQGETGRMLAVIQLQQKM